MAKSEVEIMVSQEQKVVISGVVNVVRPFSVKDVLFFMRDLFEGLSVIKAKYPSLEFKQEDVLTYIPLLLDEAPRLFDLMARSVNKDGLWLQEQNDLAGVSKLFAVITEINDFGAIISNFRQGWSNLQKQIVVKK